MRLRALCALIQQSETNCVVSSDQYCYIAYKSVCICGDGHKSGKKCGDHWLEHIGGNVLKSEETSQTLGHVSSALIHRYMLKPSHFAVIDV